MSEPVTEKLLTPEGHLPTGNWPKDELVRFVPAEPLEAEIERLRKALYLSDEGCNFTHMYDEEKYNDV